MKRRSFLRNSSLSIASMIVIPNVLSANGQFSFNPSIASSFKIKSDIHIRHGLYSILPKDKVSLGRLDYFKSDVFLGPSMDLEKDVDHMKVISFGYEDEHFVFVKTAEKMNYVHDEKKGILEDIPLNSWHEISPNVKYGKFSRSEIIKAEHPNSILFTVSGEIECKGEKLNESTSIQISDKNDIVPVSDLAEFILISI